MVADLSDREFAEMLAAIWERHGWSVEVTERGDSFLVAGDRPDGRRGVILVAPGDGQTGPGPVESVRDLQSQKGIDVPVTATRGSFSQAATEAAEAGDIHLLDPETLAETARAEGFEDLLEEYSSRGLRQRLSGAIPAIGLGSIPGQSIGRRAVGALTGNGSTVFLLGGLGLLLALGWVLGLGGFLAGLPLPGPGLLEAVGGLLGGLPLPEVGLGGGGYSATAVSLVDGGEETTTVRWDLQRGEEVVGPNGTTYAAHGNQTFVVIQFNASNPTAEPVVLSGETFAYDTDGGRYGQQPLEGARGQVPVVVPPQASARGYVVFSVPAEADSGTLLALPGPEATPIAFERDRNLEFAPEVG
jgi:hypothetical protein